MVFTKTSGEWRLSRIPVTPDWTSWTDSISLTPAVTTKTFQRSLFRAQLKGNECIDSAFAALPTGRENPRGALFRAPCAGTASWAGGQLRYGVQGGALAFGADAECRRNSSGICRLTASQLLGTPSGAQSTRYATPLIAFPSTTRRIFCPRLTTTKW
jgi:hypothetical protein